MSSVESIFPPTVHNGWSLLDVSFIAMFVCDFKYVSFIVGGGALRDVYSRNGWDKTAGIGLSRQVAWTG